MQQIQIFILSFLLSFSFPASRVHGQDTAPRNTGAVVISGDYLWVGSEDGAVRLNTNDGTFQRFRVEDDLVSPRVSRIIADSSGIIWIGFENGVSRFDGNTWQSSTTENGLVSSDVHSIAVDSTGVFWVGTGGGVSRFDGDTWQSYTEADGLASNSIISVAIDHDGSVWFGTDKGITHFDGNIWTNYPVIDSFDWPFTGTMIISPDGVKWFHTWNTVYRFDGEQWTTFKLWDFGDDSPSIQSLQFDSEGMVWLGAAGILGGRVMSYDGESWKTYYFMDCNVSTMCIDSNDVKWFTSYHNLIRFDGTTWSYYEPKDFSIELEHYKRAVADNRGRIWLVHEKAVVRFDNGAWTEFVFDTSTQIEGKHDVHPEPVLFTNTPNPFNASTVIRFTIPAAGSVSLDVYILTGQKVRTLVNGRLPAGAHTVRWDAADDCGVTVSSGVYVSRLRADGVTVCGRMLLLK